MSAPKAEALLKAVAFLGEGPHWCTERQELYFVDALPKEYVHSYNPTSKVHRKVHIEGDPLDYVTIVIPERNSKDKFIISRCRSICYMKWDGTAETMSPSEIEVLAEVHDDKPNNRFNDGKCDANGRLWIGSMGKALPHNEFEQQRGSLFSYDPDFGVQEHVDGITLSNGMAWSLDNTIMYYIDTMKHTIDAFNFNLKEGLLSNRRTVYDMKANNTPGGPDGMTIDAEGKIWFAAFGSGKVNRLDPEVGKIINYVEFPTPNLTSVMFGGPNLDILYVTSAQKEIANIADDPYAGSLFEVTNTGTKGVPAFSYNGKI